MDILLLKYIIDNLVVKHQDTPRENQCESCCSNEVSNFDHKTKINNEKP